MSGTYTLSVTNASAGGAAIVTANTHVNQFTVSDTLGNTAKVVYHYEKPYDLEKAERVTLKGKMNGDVFEISKKDGILLKCPSKYKDDPNVAKKSLSQN